jgi:DNA-binding response OmpR family regulator
MYRVLVVEADHNVREMLLAFVQFYQGFEAQGAATAAAARAALDCFHYDLVLLDLELDFSSSVLDLLGDKVRNTRYCVTTTANPEQIPLFVFSLADAILLKPFSLREFTWLLLTRRTIDINQLLCYPGGAWKH